MLFSFEDNFIFAQNTSGMSQTQHGVIVHLDREGQEVVNLNFQRK